MIRVMICDDHKLVIDGVKLMLEGEANISLTGFAFSGEELLSQIDKLEFDVLLLDINMPGLNGIDVCKTLNHDRPEIKIIALTMLKELSYIQLMMKNGAQGYLLKNAGKLELISAIKTVHSGKRYLDDEVNEIILNDISNDGVKGSDMELFPKLSRREKEILSLILEEFTSIEIGEKLFISPGTVETHRRNVISKLGVRNTAGLVRVAIEYKLLD